MNHHRFERIAASSSRLSWGISDHRTIDDGYGWQEELKEYFGHFGDRGTQSLNAMVSCEKLYRLLRRAALEKDGLDSFFTQPTAQCCDLDPECLRSLMRKSVVKTA
jgi:hypothetical protein